MFKKYQLRSYNFRLVVLLIITSSFGVAVINSAVRNTEDASCTKRQLAGLALSVIIMAVISFVDYHWILRFYWLYYIGIIVLLALVQVIGVTRGGAKRWINVGIQLQPSELAKLVLILMTAKLLSMYKDRINDWKFLAILALLLSIPLGLIVIEDLSTTITLCLILLTIIFCAGLSYRIIGLAIVILVPVVAGACIYISNPNQVLLDNYQRDRIMAFINPSSYEDKNYQQLNSVKAVGAGQLNGKGLNNDDPSSLKNNGYIAEGQTDFIFAVIGEDTGFIGCCGAIILLSWIVIECIIAAVRAKDFLGRLICCGVAGYIAFQSFINIGVVTRLLPNTGLPLPFFSYGLTSLVTLFASMGVVLNISLQRNVERDDDIFADDFRG